MSDLINTENKQIGLLSIFAIHDELSYWFRSDDCQDMRTTIIPIDKIPIKLDPSKSLISCFKDKFVLTVYSNDVIHSCEVAQDIKEFSLKDAPEFIDISFMEVIRLLPLEMCAPLFFQNMLMKKQDCIFNIQNTKYLVTSFLPTYGIFSIIAIDYDSQTNPNWITFNDLNSEDNFKNVLKNFDIVGIRVGNNRFFKTVDYKN